MRRMVRYARRGHTPSAPRGAIRIYVSESGRELRRRRQRRNRRLAVVSLLVVIAAAVFVAGGWAQDLYDRFVGADAASGRTADAPSAPASGVLIRTVTTGTAVDPPPPIESDGDGVKVVHVPRRRDAAAVRPGAAAQEARPHLEDVHRRRPDLPGRPRSTRTSPWSGSGWTGQPVIVRDDGTLYLLWGALRPQAPQDRPRDRRDRLGVRLRRHHQEQPDGHRGPAPETRGRQVPGAGRLAARLAVQLHRSRPGAVPRRVVRHRQGGLAAAGAARPPATAATWTAAGSSTTSACSRASRAAGSTSSTRSTTTAWNGYRTPEGHRLAAAARRPGRRHGPRGQPRPRGVTEPARRHGLRQLRRRPRVRHAPQRPQGGLGLPHRLATWTARRCPPQSGRLLVRRGEAVHQRATAGC